MGHHGAIALTSALSKSCNYYFFELGRRVGAMTMTDYFKKFGLGVKTGVDIGDSAGLLVEPESDGLGGNTLQIAIGQMNAFTPLQLASYVSTLANEGTRYKANLVDKIVSYDMSEVYKATEHTALETFKVDKKIINAVKEGMLSVTEDGTGSRIFSDYPIKVGGKTGTAQVTGKKDHTVFVAFAPYDDPEIAVAVIIEHGQFSTYSGGLLKSIFNSYFFTDEAQDSTQPYYELLP
jgi:penicillin-binding protein 2